MLACQAATKFPPSEAAPCQMITSWQLLPARTTRSILSYGPRKKGYTRRLLLAPYSISVPVFVSGRR